MATVNNRVRGAEGLIINGEDAGGAMQAKISAGYDGIYKSPPDGLALPLVDREIQYVRGSVVTQDWTKALSILTAESASIVFYQAESGAATYTKHTINNPVVHTLSLRFSRGGFAAASYQFECLAADETKGFADMWVPTAAQARPTYVAAARGGWRISACLHVAQAIYHILDLDFTLSMPIAKACNDADVGYTAVDLLADQISASGSLGFEDASLVSTAFLGQNRLASAKGALALTVTQSQGAAAKTLTFAGVLFTGFEGGGNVPEDFSPHRLAFEQANDTTTTLTLTGANKLITIA